MAYTLEGYSVAVFTCDLTLGWVGRNELTIFPTYFKKNIS